MSATEASFEVSSLSRFFLVFFFHQRDLKRAKCSCESERLVGCNNKRNVLPISLGGKQSYKISKELQYISNEWSGSAPRVVGPVNGPLSEIPTGICSRGDHHLADPGAGLQDL